MATALVLRLAKSSNNRIIRRSADSALPAIIGTAVFAACITQKTPLNADEEHKKEEHDWIGNTTYATAAFQKKRQQKQHSPVQPSTYFHGLSLDRPFQVATKPCLCEDRTKETDAPASRSTKKKPGEFSMLRSHTINRMDKESTKNILGSLYNIKWDDEPLGVGAFGEVYLATKRNKENVKGENGEKVAIKKIDKQYTDQESFQREMNALLDIREFGGHPNICGLQEHFNLGEHYYLVLDLIEGGELFDNLMSNGGYSEADAARLVREVASALAFLHGIGVVHADLKPENLMLSTPHREDAVVKLVDFGSAEIMNEDDDKHINRDSGTVMFTPAYCPPEAFEGESSQVRPNPVPAYDMWALGVILYIILTGVHPYDLSGDSPDEDLQARIMAPQYTVPLSKDSPYTSHLSSSAIDLISKLMNRDRHARITAHNMLNHPWVSGKTATAEVITGSDERLNKLKFKMQRKFFEDVVNWSDDDVEARHKSGLIERSYQSKSKNIDDTENGEPALTMSDFSTVLSANMNSQYYPKGHIIYREGDIGEHMYFINSGKVDVTTKDGSMASRSQGDFFGEGALLDGKKKRSATIICETPVHAMQINREYFKKVIAESGESGIFLTMREKDKIRKKNRAKVILRLEKNLKEVKLKHNEFVFKHGDEGDSLFIVDEGKVGVTVDDKLVFCVNPGNVFGENSLLTGRYRNSSAVCQSELGCITQRLEGSDFRKVVGASPNVKESLSDLCRRRDFKKSVVLRLKKDFPYENPREAFDAVDSSRKGYLDVESVTKLLREMDSTYTDEEVTKVIKALDLSNSGQIEFDEFKKVFVADIRTAASI